MQGGDAKPTIENDDIIEYITDAQGRKVKKTEASID